MRFAPAAAALSIVFAMTASVGNSAPEPADPRALMLIAQGRASLGSGDTQQAIDAFEAALAVDPSYTGAFVALAQAARTEGLQGKAITYYREALARDPGNLAAIAGEGEALVVKGAIEKARLSLNKLKSMCGSSCPETRMLAEALARGPQSRVLTAEAVMPNAVVTKN